ncbi:hypothetical protein [Guptibacillus hwajinpoensis]|uniref:hypothetical protein n=1 Tax=Guptibacillus hwajinpoensis TaxID=208199 RepID=UPI001CFDCE28|nr:hypothetical protein [Pseudalkalibacillus hwajinpoensis]WLR60162.1 hypothetical protein LC071_01860 [Pseudalkalibacillus hwajinpoensis]
MTIHHSLDYYLRIGCLPILNRYRLKDINSEYGCFIGIDVGLQLHRVLEMKAQSLKGTWNAVNDYVANAISIITDEYGEEHGIGEVDKLRDVDREVVHEIEYQLKTPPTACYPIYFISVGDGAGERLVYIGKTSSRTHRFSGGHSAALKLHAPKYDGLSKHIYFGTVVFSDQERNYMPLEFIQPYEDANNLLRNLEAGLIYGMKPELNSTYLNKNHARFDMLVNIENHSSRTNFLNEMEIPIHI